MHYQLYHNMSASFSRAYAPGDHLVTGYREEFPSCFRPLAEPDIFVRLAEHIFQKHNRDDRPDGQTAPSLSVGDVVVIGEAALSVDCCGWVNVHVDPDDIHDGFPAFE
jgi:hypothetical protein